MNLANKLTIVRLLLIPLFFVFAVPIPDSVIGKIDIMKFLNTYGVYISAIIFIIAAFTDKLDGYLARKYNQITRLGIFLDPLADKLMITAALVLLVQKNQVSVWVALIIIGREFAVTGLRLAAAQKKVVLSADKFGKIKLVSQVVAIFFTLLNNYPLSLISSFPFDIVLMYITVVFTVISGFNYFLKNSYVFLE